MSDRRSTILPPPSVESADEAYLADVTAQASPGAGGAGSDRGGWLAESGRDAAPTIPSPPPFAP